MKLSDWVGISKVYSQRAQQGKTSELFNRGRRVDPIRVSRQLERYKSEIAQHVNATSVLDPGLSIRTPPPTDGAADNTPPPSAESGLFTRLEGDVSQLSSCVDVERVCISGPETTVDSVPAPGSNPVDMFTGTGVENVFQSSDWDSLGILDTSSPDITAAFVPTLENNLLDILSDTRLENDLSRSLDYASLDMMDASGPNATAMPHQAAMPQYLIHPTSDMEIRPNEPFASTLDLYSDVSNLLKAQLLATLPFFELENILAERRNNMSPSSTVSRSSFALTELSVYDRQILLAGLLGHLSKDISTSTTVPTLTSKLSKVFPGHSEGHTISVVHQFLDPTNKEALEDLFKIACYFFSNNMLTRDQRLAFMRWIMQNNYTQRLASFLTIRSPAVDGFRHGVIASIVDMQDLSLVTQLVQVGVSFNEILAQSTDIYDQKHFDDLVRYGLGQGVFRQLSGRIGTLILIRATKSEDEGLLVRLLNAPVSPDLLSGKAGGNLLCLVVQRGYLKASKALINMGCDLNSYQIGGPDSTPLGLAIWLGHTDIVKCLVNGRADLGLVSSHNREKLLPLALAVKKGEIAIITELVEGGAGFDCKINGLDIFRWSSEKNASVYRLLCRLSGREDTLDKSKVTAAKISNVTAAEIVRVADCGPGRFTSFQEKQRADLTDSLLEQALCLAIEKRLVLATSTLLSANVNPETPEFSPKKPAISRALSLKHQYGAEDENENDYHQLVELLLNAGADLNYETVVDDLFWAIHGNPSFDAEVLETLLNGGLNTEMYGPKVLHYAIEYKHTDKIALLIEKGVSPNTYVHFENLKCQTPLQYAAECGYIDYIGYFLQHGGDINMPAWSIAGMTALQVACDGNDEQTVRYLIENGADVNAPPAVTRGSTALEASLNRSNGTELFELLLKHGALMDQHHCGLSPILCRLILRETHDQNLFQHVKHVLEDGADPNYMPTNESKLWWVGFPMTPLQRAAERANLELVELLVSHRGDVNRPAGWKRGRTALQAAASHKKPQLKLVQYLLDLGAEVDAPPAADSGFTALQGASIQGHINIVLLLLERGADPNAHPALENGRTAVAGAAEHGRLDVVKVLLNAGARPYRWGKQSGFQAEIELAEKNRHFAIADLLRSHEREFCEAC
ncbi:ankyrin repeat-containing domain protein [Stachybotrys elegans]|uniref:Ankyrin repeat-containing domain protein n=1 Tax=Stachybotrys elegans TaxID=80388 RepID=A0A8K0SVA8_9HYPO|nr:ankyrin repeat-containing domain protein [Stachybotrys elegans]